MNSLMRLALPLIFGICAAFVNYVLVSERIRTHQFIRMEKAVQPGESIDESMFSVFEMPGDYESLSRTFVNRQSYLAKGMIARRELHPGDLLLWQDIAKPDSRIKLSERGKLTFVDLSPFPLEPHFLKPGILISFVTMDETGVPDRLGPYEIKTVGREVALKEPEHAGAGARPDGRGNRTIGVSLEVDDQGQYDESARKLLSAVASKRIKFVDLDDPSNNLERNTRFEQQNIEVLGTE